MYSNLLPPPEVVQSILIWHQGALGDLLLAGPALIAVRRRYPQASIIGLGQAERWGLLSPTLALDAVWDSGESRWAPLFASGPITPELKTSLARFQLALVFSPSAATPVPERLRLAGIPAVTWVPAFPLLTGADQQGLPPHPSPLPHGGRGDKAGNPSLHPLMNGHESVGALQARHLASLGLGVEPDGFRLTLPERHGSDDLPEISGATAWLAVAPGSGQARKNWPLSHYYEVSRALAWEYQLGVVWLAGPAEAASVPYLTALAAAQGQVLLAAAPLERVAAVLARCRLFLGNDSGLSHLAAAVGGTRVLALFGPTDPAVWAPAGDRVRVLTGTCPEAPCARGREISCPEPRCLRDLAPERVLAVAGEILSASLPTG